MGGIGVGVPPWLWPSDLNFLSMAARLMRRILVDHARSKHYQKRGGGVVRISLDDDLNVAGIEPGRDLVALDDALGELAKRDERKSRVVELRFFEGLTQSEIAARIGISQMHVSRLLRRALHVMRGRLEEAMKEELP